MSRQEAQTVFILKRKWKDIMVKLLSWVVNIHHIHSHTNYLIKVDISYLFVLFSKQKLQSALWVDKSGENGSNGDFKSIFCWVIIVDKEARFLFCNTYKLFEFWRHSFFYCSYWGSLAMYPVRYFYWPPEGGIQILTQQ